MVGGFSNRWLARELVKHDQSMVGFWPLFDNAYDHSGLGNHLACKTGVSPGSTSQFYMYEGHNIRGVSLGLNNQNQYYDAGSGVDLNFNGQTPLSLSCLLYLVAISGASTLISRTTDAASGFPNNGIGYDLQVFPASGTVYAQFMMFNTTSTRYIKTVPISRAPYEKPTQIVVTYDGNTRLNNSNLNNQGVIIYINGLKPLSGITEASNLANASISNTQARFKIGNGLGNFSSSAQGGISLVRAWKRALSQKDVITLYMNEIDTHRPRRKGLPFNLIHKPIFNSMPLYVRNQVVNQKINLFLNSNTFGFNSTNPLKLSLTGGIGSGLIKTMTLYASGFPLNTHMNLFVKTVTSQTVTTTMNMFIGGQIPSINKKMNLTILNGGMSNAVSLVITGSGTLPPTGYPFNTSFNLYIKRWPSNYMPMHIISTLPKTSNITMFTKGGILVSSGMALVLPKVLGAKTSPTHNLYLSGY